MHRSYDLGMTQKRGDKGRARLIASRGETRMVHEVPEASHRLPDSKESNVWCLSSLKKSCPAQCNQRCHEKVGSCQRTFLSTKIVSSLLNTLPRWKPSSLPSAGQRGVKQEFGCHRETKRDEKYIPSSLSPPPLSCLMGGGFPIGYTL